MGSHMYTSLYSFSFVCMYDRLNFLLLGLILLSACTSASELEERVQWKTYDSNELGISFQYPDVYTDEPVQQSVIAVGDKTFSAQEVVLRSGEGEANFISVMKTTDPTVLEYVLQDNAFQTALFNNKEFLEFDQEGMGDPIGYIVDEGSYYVVLTFVFPPDENTINQIMSSLVIDADLGRADL